MNLKKKERKTSKGARRLHGLQRQQALVVCRAYQMFQTRSSLRTAERKKKKKDGVLKQHKDSEERDQTGIFTAVADCSEDNMDDRLSQVCDHKAHKAVMAP